MSTHLRPRYAVDAVLVLWVLVLGAGVISASAMSQDGYRRTVTFVEGAGLSLPSDFVAQQMPITAYAATPRATCGPGDHPEHVQGQAATGSTAFTCNLREIGHVGPRAWLAFAKYTHCAYYATPGTLESLQPGGYQGPGDGVVVVDGSHPAHPRVTTILTSGAMLYPHEGLRVNDRRGLLAAMSGGVSAADGAYANPFFDAYDIAKDCAHPRLLGSTVLPGVSGHEGNFSPDGRTFYSSSVTPGQWTALDITNPASPSVLHVEYGYSTHGLSFSKDGKRAYFAHLGNFGAPYNALTPAEARGFGNGLLVFDTSEIQARKPNPQVKLISTLFWKDGSAAQVPFTFTSRGKPYLLMNDEFGPGGVSSGGSHARIIDLSDERHPRVVSQLVLEAQLKGQGDIHYCGLDRDRDPTVAGCSGWKSSQGIRVFDIRDVHHPREIAYYSVPNNAPGTQVYFQPDGEVWFTDQRFGFSIAKFTHGVWPLPKARRP